MTLKMEPHFRNLQINYKFQENDSGYYCWKLGKRKKNTKNVSETTRVGRARARAVKEMLRKLTKNLISGNTDTIPK